MKSSRRKFLFGILAGFFATLPQGWRALGADRQRVSVDAENVAIRGYDTVAYFVDGKAARGRPEFEFEWQGARWRFASAAHRDLFSRRPESYAPQFGGFCAGAIIDGWFVRPDPEAWAIVDGKLYLNGDRRGLSEWKQDAAANIDKAQKSWASHNN
jgi:hypothetical protein